MTRVLRLLLAAALLAAPAAAMSSAEVDSSGGWTIGVAANPAAMALEAVMMSPSTATLSGVETRASVARLRIGAGVPTATERLAHGRPEPHRPRIVRRHRPSPRSADADPPH